MDIEYRIAVIEEGSIDSDREPSKDVAEELAMALMPALVQLPAHRMPSGVSVTLNGQTYAFAWELLESIYDDALRRQNEGDLT